MSTFIEQRKIKSSIVRPEVLFPSFFDDVQHYKYTCKLSTIIMNEIQRQYNSEESPNEIIYAR